MNRALATRPAPTRNHRAEARRGSIASFLIAPLVSYAVDAGLSLAALCRRLGVAEEELHDSDLRIPLRPCLELWEHVAQALDDPALPLHVIARKRIEHLRVVGLLAMASRSGWEALERAARYGMLLRTPGSWSIERANGRVKIAWASPPAIPHLGKRLADEAAVAMFLRSLRLLGATDFAAREASFSHDGPPDRGEHDAFFGCRVRFGGAYSGFTLDEGVLATISPPATVPPIAAYLVEQAEALLARLEPCGGVTELARAAIARDLAKGSVDMPACARRIGVHPRTLRRDLEAEGTTFLALVGEMRREQASNLLRNSTFSVTEIGLLLGFSETSAFTRAFKRWFDASPREFRAVQGLAP